MRTKNLSRDSLSFSILIFSFVKRRPRTEKRSWRFYSRENKISYDKFRFTFDWHSLILESLEIFLIFILRWFVQIFITDDDEARIRSRYILEHVNGSSFLPSKPNTNMIFSPVFFTCATDFPDRTDKTKRDYVVHTRLHFSLRLVSTLTPRHTRSRTRQAAPVTRDRIWKRETSRKCYTGVLGKHPSHKHIAPIHSSTDAATPATCAGGRGGNPTIFSTGEI